MVGGIAGGLLGGLDALDKGTNFWTGKTSLDLSQGYAASVNFKISETTVTGKYAGTYKGQNVFESSKLGSYKTGKYSGVTIPERGIIVGKGVFTYRAKEGMAMMQHEFGHILEYRHIGLSLLPKVYAVLHCPLVMKITYIGLKHGQTIYQKDILELIGLGNFSREIILYKILARQIK